jgi:mannose-6-phosphate isomerase
MKDLGQKGGAVMFKKLVEQPILLKHNRVKRAYTGGKLLDRWQGIEPAKDSNMSEEWLISTVEVTNIDRSLGEGLSITETEDGQNVSLMEIISSDPEGFLGKKHFEKFGNQIGVLARAGDSNVRLVIQTHPNKECARKYLNYEYGKSEAWCILDCRIIGKEAPHIYAGFKYGVSKDVWERLFEKQDIQGMLDAMHKIYVKKGDVIFIKASMPHTLGPGVLFLELHEPSDYILRLEKKYLNIRTFPDEELHCGMGYDRLFDCFDYTTYSDNEIYDHVMIQPKLISRERHYQEYKLLSHEQTNCFAMNKVLVNGNYCLNKGSSHCIVIIIDGVGRISSSRMKKEIRSGQGIFIPAGLKKVTFESNREGLELIIGYPPL